MIAAVYCRKSTEQFGVVDELRSVARQIDGARAYAASKGWTLPDDLMFCDDGISGAEFASRPAFVRLMNSLKPRPSFGVLLMADESRLGRESIEVAYALKQIITAGVRVFFVLEDRERTLDGPTDKLMLSVTAFADELEREKARQRTADAMTRKARAGHVTGGRVFGYRNVPIYGEADTQGQAHRIRVERQIDDSHAAVIRRIFTLCAEGRGYSGIAKALNADGAPCPRPQQDRPAGWGPSSVYEVLHRRLYLGEIVYGQTRKRDRWGQHKQHARPESEWIKVPAPELRIISDDEWSAAHARLLGARARTIDGYTVAPRRDRESKYLLSGLARCGQCGGSFAATSRSHGTGSNRRRVHFYYCAAFHKRGSTVCTNGRSLRMDVADRAALGAIADDVLRPEVVEAVISGVFDAMKDTPDDSRQHAADLASLDREIGRLTDAIAGGGELPSLMAALRARQLRRDELARYTPVPMPSIADRRALDESVRARLADWRGVLTRDVRDGRLLLKQLLSGPIRFTPEGDSYRLEGEAFLGLLAGGIGLPTSYDSPRGRQLSWKVKFSRSGIAA